MEKMLNKTQLIGRLTRDPDIRKTQNGDSVANIGIATSEKWKDKTTGEQKEKTEFHNVVIFGRLADIAGQFLNKGSLVYIEGKLQTRKWQDQSGNDRYSTEVVLQGYDSKMQMLGGGNSNGASEYKAPEQSQDDFEDSDIPF